MAALFNRQSAVCLSRSAPENAAALNSVWGKENVLGSICTANICVPRWLFVGAGCGTI
jgi:hypothetical protein